MTCIVQLRAEVLGEAVCASAIVTFDMEVAFCVKAIDSDVDAQTAVAAASVRLSTMHTQPTHARPR